MKLTAHIDLNRKLDKTYHLFGLPELGWSERVSDFIGLPRNSQGGSQLFGSYEQPQQPAPSTPNFDSYNQNAWNNLSQQNVPRRSAPTGGQTLGTTNTNNNQGSSVPNNDDLGRMLDEIYNPGLNYLNQQEDFTRNTEFPNAQKTLEETYASLGESLKDQETTANQKYTKQEATTATQKESALLEAMRMYKSAAAMGASRFGGGSSTGRAVGEIGLQQFLRNQSKIQGSASDQLELINDNRAQLATWAAQQSQKLMQLKEASVRDLNEKLQAKLLQIDSNRTLLHSQRSAQRADLIRDSINQARQIENTRLLHQMEIDDFKEKQGLGYAYQAGQLQAAQMAPAAVAAPSFSSFAPTQNSNIQAYKGSLSGNVDDDLSELFWGA